ncbi:sensor histidine kinase [Parapedobacter sp.]
MISLLAYQQDGGETSGMQPAVYVYEGGSQPLLINKGISYFLDDSDTLSVETISNNRFVTLVEDIPNLGITKSTAWLKFSLINESASPDLLVSIDQPSLDFVALYTVGNDGGISHMGTSGETFPFSHRLYDDNPNYVFPITLKEGEIVDLILEVRTVDQLQLPIYVGTEKSILEFFAFGQLLFGIYLGVIGIMVIYNLFVYLSVRDVAYLYYIAYIIFVGLSQALFKGYTTQYLWPDNVWMALHASLIIPVLSGVTTGFFTKQFLQVRRYSLKLDWGINIFIGCYLIGFVIGMIDSTQTGVEIIQFCAMGGSVYLLWVAEKIRRKNNRAAYFYLIAYSIFLVFVVIFVLRNFNVVPYNTFTANILEIGSVIQVTLLSFALADRINTYRKEKEESQVKAIAIAKENEKLVREQNIVLERRVEERTYALKESNASLQETLAHLKETQSQLVEAEKMASLGQLTAGVAHEINNPINFVTSNVAPLKRDINMIWDVLDEVERIALADDIPFDEKATRIDAYKEEIDVPYLKTEIDFLIKGMHEGASRTAEIVKSLRIFSRVDEESLKFADINEGLESTLVILNSVIKENITVVKEFGALPPVECYPGKLNQVFLNIITNGIYAINEKFGGKPGGILEIQTTVDAENAVVAIRDNGVGMSDQVKEKMFEPFFTTKDVGEGTGLGMSIVYNTIKKHGGEIKVDSSVGEGVSFLIVIPLKQQM